MEIEGKFVHSVRLGELEFFEGSLEIDSKGIIRQTQMQKKKLKLTNSQFVIPGFVDTHTHAPQFVNSGTGIDLPLLEWLEKYTFPAEAKFDNLDYAQSIYEKVVDAYLRNGTTTCCYYGTIHAKSSYALAKIMEEKGQRGFVGKVCMDRNSPEYYTEETEESIEQTFEFLNMMNGFEIVKPVVTPRFAPSCSDFLMTELGKIARGKDLLIQTHLSENKDEVEWMKTLYPTKSYTQVYKDFDILTDRTVMAHCIHLDETEIDILKETNVGIAHCANSNFNLNSGIFPLRERLNDGLRIGLGTDNSGGTSISMLDAIRYSMTASKLLNQPVNVAELFHLATLGGAEVLRLENIGNFEEKKAFDALIIDVGHEIENLELEFEKFLFSGDLTMIKQVFVAGKVVYSK